MHLTKTSKFEQMFSILNRALSWAITTFGNKFCLKKRSRLIKAIDNRFYVKFMQLEIVLFRSTIDLSLQHLLRVLSDTKQTKTKTKKKQQETKQNKKQQN